jgi:hypothetical protein
MDSEKGWIQYELRSVLENISKRGGFSAEDKRILKRVLPYCTEKGACVGVNAKKKSIFVFIPFPKDLRNIHSELFPLKDIRKDMEKLGRRICRYIKDKEGWSGAAKFFIPKGFGMVCDRMDDGNINVLPTFPPQGTWDDLGFDLHCRVVSRYDQIRFNTLLQMLRLGEEKTNTIRFLEFLADKYGMELTEIVWFFDIIIPWVRDEVGFKYHKEVSSYPPRDHGEIGESIHNHFVTQSIETYGWKDFEGLVLSPEFKRLFLEHYPHCLWCGEPLPEKGRSDRQFCKATHRKYYNLWSKGEKVPKNGKPYFIKENGQSEF